MKSCILYFSQTGNTKKFAETIAKSLNIPAVFDITSTQPSIVNEYDVVMIGTPVHGFGPSKESIEFIQQLPEGKGKKAILFCTYRLWKGRTFGKLKKEMKSKGYNIVLCVSVKGKEFSTESFSDATAEIAETLIS
jgi:flavodoxin